MEDLERIIREQLDGWLDIWRGYDPKDTSYFSGWQKGILTVLSTLAADNELLELSDEINLIKEKGFNNAQI